MTAMTSIYPAIQMYVYYTHLLNIEGIPKYNKDAGMLSQMTLIHHV